MEQLFIPQTPPDDDKELKPYLKRTLQDIAQNFESIADGRIFEKRHVAPPKPRDGMIVYADGINFNPGSGEGFYERIAGAWVFRNDGAVLETLFNANTILKADTDNTPAALTVAEQTLVGRITAGVITALTATQVRTLLNVEDGATADQTNAEIKTAYEANADTNEFSDAEQTKLAGLDLQAIARGWVAFNGTGTLAVSDSFNVTSVTDDGTGTYTVNWATDFANANYSIAGFCSLSTGTHNNTIGQNSESGYTKTAGAVAISTERVTDGANQDCDLVCLVGFGDQ